MSAKLDKEIPFVRGPGGRLLTRSETEAALALADVVIRWAASVDPVRWSEIESRWTSEVCRQERTINKVTP